jgi:putative mRNA 3-end processing factor
MSFYTSPLVCLTEKGLYCEAGGFYIDPHRAVDLAVVTHAHSDHARRGSKRYITVKSGIGVLRERIGKNILADGFQFGERFTLGRTQVSFHSAGHILGSAQVRIECDGEVWVCSGDYKREKDPSCDPFEPVPCDTFITEATFGTPKFVWDKTRDHGKDISVWWDEMILAKKNAILFGYSLGKAQRILAELHPFAKKPVLIHKACVGITERYREEGIQLAPTLELEVALEQKSGVLQGELIVAPSSILEEKFADRLGSYETAFASGWMQTNSPFSSNRYDRGFVMSDHADWNDLNQTILETGAKRVFVQHRNGTLIRHLRKQGIDAHSDEMLKPDHYLRLGGLMQSLL